MRTCPVESREELPALRRRSAGADCEDRRRVVEKVVVRQDPQCLVNLEHARQLLTAASERLTHQCTESATPLVLAHASQSSSFPTMAEMERAMILAAYQRSNRKPVEAARLLGIEKTTLYRKLREIGHAAA